MKGLKILLWAVGVAVSAVGIGSVVGAITGAEDEADDLITDELVKGSEEYQKIMKEKNGAEEALTRMEDVIVEEADELKIKVNQFKEKIDYRQKLADNGREVLDQIADYKESIGYDARKKEITDALNEELEKIENDDNYISKRNAQKRLIADAKDVYEKQIWFLGDDQASAAAKKSARKTMNKTIDLANEELARLEKENKKLIKKAKATAEEQLTALDSDVELKRRALYVEANKKMEPLRKKVGEEREKIYAEIKRSRMPEDQALFDQKDDLRKTVAESIHRMDELRLNKYSSMSNVDRVVLYLQKHNVTKSTVACMGAASGIPLFYASVWWTRKIIEVLSRL